MYLFTAYLVSKYDFFISEFLFIYNENKYLLPTDSNIGYWKQR